MVLEGLEVVDLFRWGNVGGWRLLWRLRLWRGHREGKTKNFEIWEGDTLRYRRNIMKQSLRAASVGVASGGMTEELRRDPCPSEA